MGPRAAPYLPRPQGGSDPTLGLTGVVDGARAAARCALQDQFQALRPQPAFSPKQRSSPRTSGFRAPEPRTREGEDEVVEEGSVGSLGPAISMSSFFELEGWNVVGAPWLPGTRANQYL